MQNQTISLNITSSDCWVHELVLAPWFWSVCFVSDSYIERWKWLKAGDLLATRLVDKPILYTYTNKAMQEIFFPLWPGPKIIVVSGGLSVETLSSNCICLASFQGHSHILSCSCVPDSSPQLWEKTWERPVSISSALPYNIENVLEISVHPNLHHKDFTNKLCRHS